MPEPEVLRRGSSVGEFEIRDALGVSDGVSLYRAFESRLGRDVLVRVASADSAARLRDDARRVAGIAHPNLVPVLAVAEHESGSYAATPDLGARPLRELLEQRPLTGPQIARIASDIAGAVEALAAAGVRIPLGIDTILVASDAQGERALLDPLRAPASEGSRLEKSDVPRSTQELAELFAELAPAGNREAQRAVEAARSGALTQPSELASALSALARVPKSSHRRRAVLLVAAAIAVCAVAAAIVVLAGRGSRAPAVARTSHAPAGRVLARIPLGLGAKEHGVSIAIDRHTVWVATDLGRLIEVDADSNQVVGDGVALGKQHRHIYDIVAAGGKIWVADSDGVLLRVDARTGRITGRLQLRKYLSAMRADGGVLWVTRGQPSHGGELLRISEQTMRKLGPPVALRGGAASLVVRGKIAWVTSWGTEVNIVERIDVESGRHSKVALPNQPIDLALQGNTLWVSEYTDGIAVPIEAATMRHAREALPVKRSPVGIGSDGRDVWIAAQDAFGASTSHVYRLDGKSGRRVGQPVAISATPCCLLRIMSGLGSIWTLAGGALVRLAPTTPRPALGPAVRTGSSPRALRAGPLAGGLWRDSLFAAPVTFRVPAFAWQAGDPYKDSITLVTSPRGDSSIAVLAPRQVFVTEKKLRPVRSVAGLLALMRANKHLRVGIVHHITMGGRPALQFTLSTRDLEGSTYCGSTPCAPLFPMFLLTMTVDKPDKVRLTIFESNGHTIAIQEDSQSESGLAATAALLRTFRFAA